MWHVPKVAIETLTVSMGPFMAPLEWKVRGAGAVVTGMFEGREYVFSDTSQERVVGTDACKPG